MSYTPPQVMLQQGEGSIMPSTEGNDTRSDVLHTHRTIAKASRFSDCQSATGPLSELHTPLVQV